MMKNETIKTYTEITIAEAFELAASGTSLCFSNNSVSPKYWTVQTELKSIRLNVAQPYKPYCCASYAYCAKVTELDPCQAPDGCPKLEPWLAYVGTNTCPDYHCYYFNRLRGWVNENVVCGSPLHVAIDVRTEWSLREYPEHCRIRNYQEPDAFEEWFSHERFMGCKSSFREAYELGQANPTKGIK